MHKISLAVTVMLALAVVSASAAPKRPARHRPAVKAKTAAKARAAAKFVTKQTTHFTIKSNLPAPFPEAITKICETSLDGFRDRFGFSLYPNPDPGDKRMVIWAALKPGQRAPAVAITGSGKAMELRLAVPSEAALNPPAQGGAALVSGLVRAFASRVMSFDSTAFTQGFTDYLTDEVVGYVHSHLGDQAWPRPYNYAALDNITNLQERAESIQPGTPEAATLLLAQLSQSPGRDTLSKALRLLALSPRDNDRPALGTTQKVAALSRQLIDLTGDGEIAETFKAAHFSTVMDPVSITAAELFACADKPARCKLLCDRWGTNATGILDGKPVELLFQAAPTDRPKAVATPDGLTLEPQPGGWSAAWYQASTQRTYVAGRVRLTASGSTVENVVLGPDGRAVK